MQGGAYLYHMYYEDIMHEINLKIKGKRCGYWGGKVNLKIEIHLY